MGLFFSAVVGSFARNLELGHGVLFKQFQSHEQRWEALHLVELPFEKFGKEIICSDESLFYSFRRIFFKVVKVVVFKINKKKYYLFKITKKKYLESLMN
jgi:hypothetical protein